jgi:hypothetical protein
MTMVKMGTIWDRTTAVLSGRAGALGGVATVTLFLPLTLMLAWTMFFQPKTSSGMVLTLVLYLAAAFVGLLGALAMTALASDPETTTASAWARARSRILTLCGVTLVLVAVAVLALLPVILILAASRVDMTALTAGGAPRLSGGLMTIVALYYILFMVFLLWFAARLSVLNAVVLHERLGLGAIRRSFQLTRGITWRLIGVLLLYAVVLFVVRAAIQSVVGLVLRLILGADQIAVAVFVAGMVGAAITTIFSVLAATFAAQLYVALTTTRQPTAA